MTKITIQHTENPLLNPFQNIHQTAPFNSIKIEHYLPAFDAAIEETKAEVQQIIDNPSAPDFVNTIVALDLAGEKLERIKGIFFNLNSAETSDEMQEIAQEIAPKLSDLGNDISLNEQLFARIKEVHNQKDNLVLNVEESTLLEKTYRRFVRSGANLNETDKAKYREITKELSTLGLQYQQNVLAETNAYELLITDEKDLSGLPASVIELAAQTAQAKDKQGWLFNLQYPSYFPFLKYADNRSLREQIFRASSSRANHENENDNKSNIKRLVELRLEKANLLGFKTHAAYKLQERMAETPEKVIGFLEELHQQSKPFALKEFAEVQEYAKKAGFEGIIQRWDWAYYSEKLKSEKYDYTDEEVKPYLQLEKVISGVFQLAQKLYGLGLKENKSIEVYHPDVMAYEVYNEKEEFIAVLYLDFFPRESKRSGAWMTDYRTQSNVNGNSVRPHVSLVTNFTKSTETTPSLLTFDEVTTFLHEFGHGLHGMLSQCQYPGTSGTSVYWDFVELPSQMHENWAYEKEWLDTFAVHFHTGEKMPQELIQKIQKAQNFQAAYMMERQLSFAMLDMAYHHGGLPSDVDLKAFEMSAIASTDLFEPVDGSLQSTSFSHIFSGGYDAGYYSYKWAEVLDADAFSVFQERGIFDRETADSFRKNILEKGGSEHPMILYKAFRGQEPTATALLKRNGLI
ncbi:dipeptidyl carboxypeptidase Dcp [Aquipluma nitroreducens]|uniref:Dipeptidyl carboxypeptidase Dcp n=1 Tax=Aquipluma nitroreducens TaxID=2010828 RepID=A0A5K7S8R8_9BACT|nr:M3 family metallopeptidase [Aquipluma nitroreducens]BBE17940.1 dipeptidyl carboxypeptidase Dcp [Aquipluma nitroreducens]